MAGPAALQPLLTAGPGRVGSGRSGRVRSAAGAAAGQHRPTEPRLKYSPAAQPGPRRSRPCPGADFCAV